MEKSKLVIDSLGTVLGKHSAFPRECGNAFFETRKSFARDFYSLPNSETSDEIVAFASP